MIDVLADPENALAASEATALAVDALSVDIRTPTGTVRAVDSVMPAPDSAEDVVAAARAMILEAELRRGATVASLREHDIGRESVLPLLKAAQSYRNRVRPPFGYGAIDGGPVPQHDHAVPLAPLPGNARMDGGLECRERVCLGVEDADGGEVRRR